MNFELPPDWRAPLHWLAVTWALALLGRVAWRIQQSRSGGRRFWSWALLCEIPIAAFCGIAGAGVGDWFGLEGKQLYAAISVVAYLGPGGIEALAGKLMDRVGKP